MNRYTDALVFLNQVPSDGSVEDFYEDSYYEDGDGEDGELGNGNGNNNNNNDNEDEKRHRRTSSGTWHGTSSMKMDFA